VLLILYLVQILLMKFNKYYEVAIKKSLQRGSEISFLTKKAVANISDFHRVVDLRSVPDIKKLCDLSYHVEYRNKLPNRKKWSAKYILKDYERRTCIIIGGFKKTYKPIRCVKHYRDPLSLAELDNITAVAKHKLKKATLKIIEMIRVYHMTEKINQHDSCDSDLSRILRSWKDPSVSYRESEDSCSEDLGHSEKSVVGSRYIRL
jgi:hypothetical protein